MLKLLFRAWACLPLPLAHQLGAWLGPWVYRCSGGYRRRFDAFIRQAGFDEPAVRRAALREAGKALAELPWLWMRVPDQSMAFTHIEGWEYVEAAQRMGQGVVFLTPHIGCFEITAQCLARHAPITVLYSPPEQAALRPLVEAARQRHQLQTAPANLAGVKQLLRALKRGEWVGILPDQVPNHANEGVWADFFGRPAYTMTLPLRLHAMTGAPLVLVVGERLPRGAGYRVRFTPFNEALEGTLEQQARKMNVAMEDLVRQYPAQYLWAYSRYKQPLGAEPPPPRST